MRKFSWKPWKLLKRRCFGTTEDLGCDPSSKSKLLKASQIWRLYWPAFCQNAIVFEASFQLITQLITCFMEYLAAFEEGSAKEEVQRMNNENLDTTEWLHPTLYSRRFSKAQDNYCFYNHPNSHLRNVFRSLPSWNPHRKETDSRHWKRP